MSSGDASAGWALVASDGAVRFIIPNGTRIPAYGRFLAVNGFGYGLGNYPAGNNGSAATTATGDAILLPDGRPGTSYELDIPDGAGLALCAAISLALCAVAPFAGGAAVRAARES